MVKEQDSEAEKKIKITQLILKDRQSQQGTFSDFLVVIVDFDPVLVGKWQYI